jgi:hypothetical protein
MAGVARHPAFARTRGDGSGGRQVTLGDRGQAGRADRVIDLGRLVRVGGVQPCRQPLSLLIVAECVSVPPGALLLEPVLVPVTDIRKRSKEISKETVGSGRWCS